MADNQIVTNIVATSDFSNLIADVNKVANSLAQLQGTISSTNKQLQAQVAVMNRSFADTIRSTGQFSKHFITLTSDVESFGKNLDSGRLKLRDYFRVYQDHVRTSGGLIRDLAKQQIQMQNAIVQPLGRNAQGLMQFNVHVPRGLDVIKNKTALARQELSIMNKVIQDGGVQLINWGKNTQWAGRQLTVGLTLPLAAFGKAAADAFRQADQELTRLTKVYGDIAGTSKKELSSIRKEVAQTAKELSAAMGVNFSETIALAADIAATGKQGNELLSSIKETTRLAVLGEVDRQEAMKATLAIQSAFKQNTDQLAESINFLNAVENQTSTTLNDLVEAIPKAGPVIKGLGGDVQDLALYLTAMREGGINASEGANALKSALASLINPTDVAVKKFEGFGIDLLGIVNKNAGNVTSTLFALQGALDKLDPLQKQQAIEQLFGKFQFSRLNALFENLGRQGSQTLQVLDLMKASTMQLGSIADRELAAVTESASGRYKRAVESLRADLAGVGDKFLNIATKLINGLDSIINFLQKLPDPVKNLLTVAGAFTAIAGPVIMLTGVMANFVGYLIKGYGHIKAFLKGGEGFKLLTPQMIAAEKAANLVASSLYSDAKAADILHTSLTRLKNDFLELQTIAAKGSISVQPTLSTAAGSIVIPGGGYRPVDPTNPFVGGMASSHINPRDPKNPATLFGLVPGAEFVNMKIGRTPQIFMEERLPNIPGLTSVSTTLRGKPYDVSTGIVAGEAARYQALMATLGMQSKQEIIELKKTVETGGAISTDFIATFDDLLPITTRLSTNAARQSAAIVAQLQAGKLTVDQARMEIIRINAQLEAALAAEVGAYAAGRGRSIDVTKVPLLDQPVVDPKTGKPNMRALFREGRMQDVMFAVGRATRTRTLGAPYSIETTLPPRFNAGGRVERFGRSHTRVSGPSSINYDDRLGSLPENGYVLSQEASRRFPELVALAPYTHTNTPGTITAAVTPAETVFGSGIHSIPGLPERLDQANFGMNIGGRIKKGRGNYGQFKIDPKTLRRAHITDDLSGMVILLPDYINAGISAKGSGVQAGMIATALKEMLSQGIDPNLPMIDAATTLGGDKSQASRRLAAAMSELINELDANPERVLGGSAHPMSFERLAKGIYRGALRGIRINPQLAGGTNNLFSAVSQIFSRRAGRKITKDRAIELGIIGGEKTGSNILGQIVRRKSGRLSWSMPQQNIGADVPDWARGTALTRLLTTSTGLGTTVSGYQKAGRLFDSSLMEGLYARLLRRNSGGYVPGRAGGRVVKGRFNYGEFYQDPFTGLILPTSVQPGQTPRMVPPVHGGSFIPLSSVTSGAMGGVPLSGGAQTTNPYLMGALSGRQRMMGMGASMAGIFGGGYLGSQLTGGSMLGYMGGSMLGEFAAIAAFNKLGKAAGDSAQKTSILSRGISLISTLPGPVKLVGVVLAVGGAIKAINDKIKEHRAIVNQAFAPTENTVEKLKLKYESLNDTLKTAKARIEALEKAGTSLFERNNQTGIPGLTLTIQQLKELQEAVKTDFPDLIDIFNKAQPDEVIGKAAQLKAQFVAGGMSAQDASNLIYTLVAASNDATLAIQAINSKGFKEIKTGAEAAAFSIKTMFDLIESGNVDQLSAAFDQAYNSLRNYEKSLINTKDDQGEILDRVGALEKTLQLITAQSEVNVELSGKQLEAIKKQNPELRSILGNVEDTAGAYAKIQLYTMGITGNLQDMNSAAAQAKLITITGVISTLESTTGPFAALAKQISTQQKIVNAAGVQAAKVFAKTRDQINQEIKLRQKNIQQIKEEADARIKALQEAQEDEDILLKIKEKQLDYQAALAAGDLSGATAAQLEIQGLVKQQQRTLAIRSIQTDADNRIKVLEEEVDALQNKLDAAQTKLDQANNNAADATKKLADLESLMDKAIEAVLLKLNDGIITESEKAIINSTRELFKNKYPEIYKLLDPNIKIPMAQSPLGTFSDSLLNQVITANGKALRVYLTGGADSVLNLFKGDQASAGGAPAATPAKYEAVQTGTKTTFTKDGKEISAEEYNKGQYSPGAPPVGAGRAYVHPIAELRQRNFGNRAAVIKAYDELGYKNGIMTSSAGWKYYSTGKVIGPNGEQGVWFDARVRSYNKGTTDGPVAGPGTPTSDSIIARLSDGEYVTKAVSVSDIGVNNMHLINTKGSQGLLEAARNIVEENKAMGGLMGYPMGGLIPYNMGGMIPGYAIGGFPKLPKPKDIFKGFKNIGSSISRTFNNVMEYLGLVDNDPTTILIQEELFGRAAVNAGVLPALPMSAKQSKYLEKQYRDLFKSDIEMAARYKGSKRTVGSWNKTMEDAANLVMPDRLAAQLKDDISKFEGFTADSPEMEAFTKDPWQSMTSQSPEGQSGGIQENKIPKGLQTPNLFGKLPAPENMSLYDYWLFKSIQTKLIADTYADIARAANIDMARAIREGLIKPRDTKGFAFGGMVGKIPGYFRGGIPKLNPFKWLAEKINKKIAESAINNKYRYAPLQRPDETKQFNYLSRLTKEEIEKMYPGLDLTKTRVPGINTSGTAAFDDIGKVGSVLDPTALVNIGLTRADLLKIAAKTDSKYLPIKPKGAEEVEDIIRKIREAISQQEEAIAKGPYVFDEENPKTWTIRDYNKYQKSIFESKLIGRKPGQPYVDQYGNKGVNPPISLKELLEFATDPYIANFITKEELSNPAANLLMRAPGGYKAQSLGAGIRDYSGEIVWKGKSGTGVGGAPTNLSELEKLMSSEISWSEMDMLDFHKFKLEEYKKMLESYKNVEALIKTGQFDLISKFNLFPKPPAKPISPYGMKGIGFALGGYATGSGPKVISGMSLRGIGKLFSGLKNKIFKPTKSPLLDPLNLKVQGVAEDQVYINDMVSLLTKAINQGRSTKGSTYEQLINQDPYTGVPKTPFITKGLVESIIFRGIRNPGGPAHRSSYNPYQNVISLGMDDPHYKAPGTIMHELMHAVSYQTGIGNKTISDMVSEKYYEELLDSNKITAPEDFVKFITGEKLRSKPSLFNTFMDKIDADPEELAAWARGASMSRGLEEGIAETMVTNILKTIKESRPKLYQSVMQDQRTSRGFATYITEEADLELGVIKRLKKLLETARDPKVDAQDLFDEAIEFTPEFIDSYLFSSSGVLTQHQVSSLSNLSALLTKYGIDAGDALVPEYRGQYIKNISDVLTQMIVMKGSGKTLAKTFGFSKGGQASSKLYPSSNLNPEISSVLDKDNLKNIYAMMLTAGDITGLTNLGRILTPAFNDPGLSDYLISATLPLVFAKPGMLVRGLSSSAGKGSSIADASFYASAMGRKFLNTKTGKFGMPAVLGSLIAAMIGDTYKQRKSDVGLAGGGYINPSYFSSMSMPSYATGVKYLYDDTIAQLHKGEAVIPEHMNPFNPNATAPISGGNKLVYIAPTINAAPGMDIEQLTDVATRKIVEVMRKSESDYSARAGEKLSMTRRYV